MPANIREVSTKPAPRFINPNAPLAEQWANLKALREDPPENSRTITFCPKLAEMILAELNTHNRKPKPSRTKRYREAMAAGKWLLTGDTIKFGRGTTRKLIDGQNRLNACVLANKPFRSYVVFGIDEDAFHSIDVNAQRTNVDTSVIAGIPYPSISAKALRWIMLHKEWENSDLPLPDRSKTFSNQELLEYWQEHVDQDRLHSAAELANSTPGKIPPGNLAAQLYIFGELNGRVTERFVHDLIDGKRAGRKLNDKLKTLRAQTGFRVQETQINAMIRLAWNAYRRNETVTSAVLNWNDTKDYPHVS